MRIFITSSPTSLSFLDQDQDQFSQELRFGYLLAATGYRSGGFNGRGRSLAALTAYDEFSLNGHLIIR